MLEWFLEPWRTGAGFVSRAARIFVMAALLTAVILPGMILYFGVDGWWWDSTASVCLSAPLAIVIADQLAEKIALRGWYRIGALFFGFVAGVSFGYLIIFLFRMTPDRSPEILWRDYQRNMSILIPIVGMVVVLGASLWYRAENFRLQSENAIASFNVLKEQMQPHFLFNALNALKELIVEDPEIARATTQRLADLYRSILAVSTTATTPLSDELSIIRDYLEIERVRFGDRLRFRFEIEPHLERRHVPSLMVQTLVENAVKHGIAKSRTGGEIVVRARPAPNGALELEVWNDGAPFVPADGRASTGLANTRARLELMYGSTATITTGDGTTVRFVVSGDAR